MTAQNVVDVPPGTHIRDAALLAIGKANTTGLPASFSFNEIEVTAQPGDAPNQLVKHYDRELKKRGERWRKSPAGKAAAQAAADQVAALQARANELAAAVGTLDLSDQPAVLGFLADLQRCSDHVGVKVDRHEILVAFAFGGLVPNMAVGTGFDANNRDTYYRWLVGQALDGLSKGPSIHGVFHTFADVWRSKWGQQ